MWSCLWMANANRSRNVWSLNRYRHSANGLRCRVDLANTLTKRVKGASGKRLRLVVNIYKICEIPNSTFDMYVCSSVFLYGLVENLILRKNQEKKFRKFCGHRDNTVLPCFSDKCLSFIFRKVIGTNILYEKTVFFKLKKKLKCLKEKINSTFFLILYMFVI